MDAVIYAAILQNYLMPFAANSFGGVDVQLHQDNDTKHHTKLCRDVLDSFDIQWVCKIRKKSNIQA